MGYPVRHLLLALVMGLVGLGAAYAAKPLTQVHAHLDKQEECNRCHVAFGGVPEEKCRSCHLDIDRRVKANQGFHGREAATVKCYDCHREHLGRGHDITGLDRDRFDHRKTGWPLTGNHEQVRCRSCHTAKRPQTGRDSYLGASTRCADCHGEYHGQARKSDLGQCDRCHNTYGWEQLNANLRFDHERETRFPRTGKHMQVECAKCHQGKRAFGPIAVQSCTTCHADPHPPGIFRERICDECHVTKGWKDASAFSHASTGWPLKGRHQKVECLNCHSWKKWKPRTKDCAGCHDDAHRGQFAGTPCGRCHQESGFKNLVFNHDTMSRFPLRGRHRRVDCARCHPGGKYKPVEDTCESCHGKQNPHGDTFEGRPCANCHSPVDWKQTRFDHGITGFPLAGQHEDQPCYRCHPEGTETQVDTPPDCDWCHQDLHRGQFEQRACDDCHKGFERFSIPLFDHTVARFQLQGKHLDVSCDGCHKDGHYRPIDTACANCHQNFHAPQFEKKCEECHTAAAWSEEVFDHDRQSDYRLAGQHRRIDCAKCHVQNDYKGIPQACEGCHLDVHAGTKGPDCDRCHTAADWTTNRAIDHDFGAFSLGGAHDRLPCERCHGENREIQLAGTGPECVGCHKDPHFGSLGPFCHDCHSQDQFLPSTFLHDRTGFRLSGSHRFVACRDCHPGRVYGGLPSTCDFCHTDTFQRTAGTDCDHPAQCANGVSTCQTCHTTLGFLPARPGSACGTCEAGGPAVRGALLCAAVALAPAAAAAAPVEVDGRVSLRGIYSADAPNNPQTFLSFLETDARASGLTDGDLRLVLDATFILDVTETNERRFGETERLDQIRNLYVELPGLGGRVDLRVGRRIIPEAGNAWVDGVEARFWVDPERASVGAYGGLAPDPFDRAFGTTFQAAGLYGTLHRPGLTTSAAYNTVLRDAEVDRQFVFHRLHWKVADGLFLSTYLVFDFVDVPEVTTLLGTVDYTPVRALNLTLTTSRYSIEQYRDQTVYRNIIEPNQALLLGNEVVDLVYNRVRFSGSLRVYSSGFHYQSVEYKQRSQDGREAWLYTIGIRDEDVLGTGVRADLQGQVANEFQSDTALVALDLRRDVGAAWTLGGRLGWFDGRTIGRATERGRAFDEAQRILLIGAQVAWRASASHHVDVIYDGAGETELQDQRNGQNLFIHTAMARYSWLY